MKNRIREMREKRGLSQNDLAKMLDTTGVSISRYEKENSRVNLPLLDALAKALRCTPCDLISDNTPASLVAIPIRCGAGVMHMDSRELNGLGEVTEMEAVKVHDNSMAPLLDRGDICVVDTSATAVTQGAMAFDAAGQTIIRRVVFDLAEQEFQLYCDNGNYPPAPLDAHITPVGRVVMMIRRLA